MCFFNLWFLLFSYLGLGHWCGVYNYRSADWWGMRDEIEDIDLWVTDDHCESDLWDEWEAVLSNLSLPDTEWFCEWRRLWHSLMYRKCVIVGMCTDWGVQVMRDQLYYVVLYIALCLLYIDKLLDVADTGFDYLIVFISCFHQTLLFYEQKLSCSWSTVHTKSNQ